MVTQQSLRVVRVQHTHEIVSRGHDELDDCELVMQLLGTDGTLLLLMK